jgi:AcrR family transcriptional regulator
VALPGQRWNGWWVMGAADSPKLRADARRNRDRLLAAALAAFAERGSDDTSLEEIARRAGVGIGTLYRHFPTRQSLLEAVYRDQVDAICARAQELLADPAPAAALLSWMRAMVAFGLTKRRLTAELAATDAMDSPVFAACRAELADSAGALLRRAQESGVARPELEPFDIIRLSHAVVAVTERAADREAEAERMLQIMLGGVLAPGAAVTQR